MNKQLKIIKEITTEEEYCIEEYCPKCTRTEKGCIECMKKRLKTINKLINEMQ